MRFRATQPHPVVLTLPMPNGVFSRFAIEESPVMEPELAAQFPQIRTFRGQGIDDPTATMRCDITPHGFHAQILSILGTVYVDPFKGGDRSRYISYDKKGLRSSAPWKCLLDETVQGAAPYRADFAIEPLYSNGGTLRTYRLALACTGEYAVAVCNHNGVAVTVANTLSAMTTSVNRVNGVYERELSIHMNLVANNSLLVFTDAATDPYTNTNASSLLSQNQSTCDSKIGNANYDIGHVFSTGGGGLAGLGVVCGSRKAQGETGSSSPYGDGYDIDYVAHEMGHEFGANHTFISTTGSCSGNGNASTAYERGSGVTIMAYAGICGADDLAPHSYDYFHSISLNEISNYVGSVSCSQNTASGNNAPSLTIGPNYTNVPVGTPFTLTVQSASDPDGDTLTYCWEDWQLGANCLFRPQPLSTSPSRTFPQMVDVLSGAATPWETLPTSARTMTFRCAVRDNRAGAGAFTSATMTVSFVAGAFSVSAPNTAVSWPASSSQTVTWIKGGSTSANVKISLSTNGGTTWTALLASTPNDGSEVITVPNTPSTTCRIKVEPTDNIYFDVSNVNFTISSGTGTVPAAPSSLTASGVSTTQINVSWVDNSNNETGFKLERKTGSGGTYAQIATTAAGTTSYSNTGLTAGTTYYYRVRATNAVGDSVYSNEANATTSSSGNTISCGETKAGILASGDAFSTVRTTSYADSYSFSGTAGQQVTITMNNSGSSLDSWLVLKSPTGAVLAQDDDSNGGTNSKLIFTLTSTGTHTIEATSYYASTNANGAGAYNLTLACGIVNPDLVLNGGFESGTTNWVFAANSSVTAGSPQAGTNKAQQLGLGSTTSTNFYQPIPGFTGTAKTLRFYLKMASAEGTSAAYDYLRVKLKNTSGTDVTTLATFSNQNKSTYANWTLVTVTIPATAAVANYRLSFDASEDYSLATTFFIDSVSIQ